MKNLLFVTTSRADWNGLGMVAKAALAAGHKVQVAATGQHVWHPSPTIGVIVDDGFRPATFAGLGAVEGAYDDTTAVHGLIVRDLGMMIPPYTDFVVIAGDRWETHAVATAAALRGVPIAHIAGGDVTIGSLDDKLRDSITMLSQLHFPTHKSAGDRLWNMLGGPERRIFDVGSPAIDRLLATPTLSGEETFKQLGVHPGPKNILIAFHPDTIMENPAFTPQRNCMAALEALAHPDFIDSFFLILEPNADDGGDKVRRVLQAFADNVAHAKMVKNLPAPLFYSVLNCFDMMIGNSSAGIYEAPYFGIPVVNVGDRQEGRPEARNVMTVNAHTATRTVIRLQLGSRYEPHRLFGIGGSADQIVNILGNVTHPRDLLRRQI